MSRIHNPQEGIYKGIQLLSEQGYEMGDWEIVQTGEGWAALNIDIEQNFMDYLLEVGYVEFRSEEDDVIVRAEFPTGAYADAMDAEQQEMDHWDDFEALSDMEDDYLGESLLKESDLERRKREREAAAFGGAENKIANMRDRMRFGEAAVPCTRCEVSGEVPEFPHSASMGMDSPVIECPDCNGYGYKSEEQILRALQQNQEAIQRNEEYRESMTEYFGGAASWDLQYNLCMQSYGGNNQRLQEQRNKLQNELHQVGQMKMDGDDDSY